MAVYRLQWDEKAPANCQGAVLTVGNFDGVHRGHAALLARLRIQAGTFDAPAVAITFDPHPLLLLRPEHYQPTLTTIEERSRLLQVLGADHVVVLHTEPALLKLSAEEFFQRVIVDHLQARGMVEGPNFAFGHNREGNVVTLARLCATDGMNLEIVQPLELDDEIVSSSRVRRALLAGDVAAANHLLGRPYRLYGVVETGQRRGQQLGFPTANLSQVRTLIPGDGVYAVRGWIGGDTPPALPSQGREKTDWPGAANVGPNPTFGEQVRKVEVHLIGFQGDLYGQTLAVGFLARLRDTRRFESVEQLQEQLRRDVAQARELG